MSTLTKIVQKSGDLETVSPQMDKGIPLTADTTVDRLLNYCRADQITGLPVML